jgi:hypothetical protein
MLDIDARGITMNIKKVREIVKKKGVNIKVGRKKEDMIRDYQLIEGNSPCFHTKDSCGEDCLWKEDCRNVC